MINWSTKCVKNKEGVESPLSITEKIPQGSGIGDLYVKYLVWIPKKLKSSEKDALESTRQSESFVPNLSREDKNLFDKMKENF